MGDLCENHSGKQLEGVEGLSDGLPARSEGVGYCGDCFALLERWGSLSWSHDDVLGCKEQK